MWLLPVLEFTYRVIIYRCIKDIGNVGRNIYSINGSDKTYLRQKLA